MPLDGDAAIRSLLERIHSIAVVGIKADEREDAHRVPAWLQSRGYRVLPVSPKLEAVLGESCVPSLGALEERPDLVNLFRAPRHVPGHVDEILALPSRPVGVWMQLGIRHPEATRRLEAAGIEVVEDRCLMVECARLLPDRERAPLPPGPAR